MSETARESHYRDRLQSLWRLASLPEAERAAISGTACEDLVALCLELSQAGRDLFELEYHQMFKDDKLTVAWLQERRRVIEDLSNSYLQLAGSIRSLTQHAQQNGPPPSGEDLVSQLDVAIGLLADTKRRILEHWLVGGSAELGDAKDAIARGETLDAGEAFAEIAGMDTETWRNSVAEYKRRRAQAVAE